MSVSSLQQFGNVSTVILYDTVIDENWKITRVKKKKFIYLDSEIFLYNNQSRMPLRISVLFLFHFFVWNCWPFSCYYNVHRNIDKINYSKTKNIFCEIMLLAPFFDLDFCSPIGQLRPLIPALRMDYYLQYLSRL